jgi:hypothetical protein
MKKLMMFAAAMTIVGGAYASDCDVSKSLVYAFKASVKTTFAKDQAATDCDAAVCYRKCGSATLKGYLWYCGADDCTALAGLQFVAQETKGHSYVFGSADAGVTPTWTILNQIGKVDKNVEALWSAEDTDSGWSFTAAGCGKYDTKNARISSISGDLVGMGPGPSCELTCDATSASTVTLLCDVTTDDANTIVYGSWSIKYNSKYSKEGCGTACDTEATMPAFPVKF